MFIQPQHRAISSSTTSRIESTPTAADRDPLDRYTPQLRPTNSSTPPPQPRGSFWKGAAVGGGVAALGCLALGATGPLGWMVMGCAALVGGVHNRDGGVSQEKLEHLEDWNRQLQDS